MARNLTQRQVADAIVRTPQTIRFCETGRVVPFAHVLRRLSNVLGVPLTASATADEASS